MDETFPLFADMESENETPNEHIGMSHNKELTKNGWQKMLPTWSTEEQSEYFRSPQFESEYSKEVVQRAYENIGYSVDPFEGISKLQYLDRAL